MPRSIGALIKAAKSQRVPPADFIDAIPCKPAHDPVVTFRGQASEEVLHLTFVLWSIGKSEREFMGLIAHEQVAHRFQHMMSDFHPIECIQHKGYVDGLTKILAGEQHKMKCIDNMLDLALRMQFMDFDPLIEFGLCRDDSDVLQVVSFNKPPQSPFAGMSPMDMAMFMAASGGFGGSGGFDFDDDDEDGPPWAP
jgi:hypothetical protein